MHLYKVPRNPCYVPPNAPYNAPSGLVNVVGFLFAGRMPRADDDKAFSLSSFATPAMTKKSTLSF